MDIEKYDYPLFPAWAGVILDDVKDDLLVAAIPRMGGGDPWNLSGAGRVRGYSPHGRG